MKAMILAAGRGTRLKPLTDITPKPLISVAGKPLIAYRLEALAKAGIKEVVINLSYHAEEIQQSLGDGRSFGLDIRYSLETETGGLETGGGIFRALAMLSDPFIVVNSDIWTDFDFAQLPNSLGQALAHLVLVTTPGEKTSGDFDLDDSHQVLLSQSPRLTFSGIGVYQKALFKHCQPGWFKLASVLKPAIEKRQILGSYYKGEWRDAGTLPALQAIRNDCQPS